MKKIGIITHYYKSNNFGGNFQAYALCKFLSNNGYIVEQICFPFEVEKKHNNNKTFKERLKEKNFFELVKAFFRLLKRVFIDNPIRQREEKIYNVQDRRKKAFEHFNQKIIPHSAKVYHTNTIQECINDYEIFITGSDQVWNFSFFNSAYFLTFVPEEKIKISYAASLAMDSLNGEQEKIIEQNLKGYKAVSCREKSGVELIEKLSPVQPCNVIDPTLLLELSDWEEIREECPIDKDYIFCYFLGTNKKERRIAKQFAKKHRLFLVTIPHAGGWIELADCKFGDKRLFDVSPQQFISLIKNARYIFTDSFHAVVFSFIYKKQYFVFNRDEKGSMSSRIKDIMHLFQTTERFCFDESREKLSYIENLKDIDYTKTCLEFEKIKKESMDFLLMNLEEKNE